MDFTKKDINDIIDRLKTEYPDAGCALEHIDVFELLISVVLSAQTTDVSVNKVTQKLFAKYSDVWALKDADNEDVQEIIKAIGLYRRKSKNIIQLSEKLCSVYSGKVPDKYEELIKLPGVGRKTANVVLAVGFGQQRIAVDTHVFRVTNRIGIVSEKDVLKTELSLMEALPENRWTEAHHSFIFHGRKCCIARKPHCERCCVEGLCKKRI